MDDGMTYDRPVHSVRGAGGGDAASSRGSPRAAARPASDILLNARQITLFLGVAIAILISASLAGQVAKYQFGLPTLWGLVNLFYIDSETNLPTMFQVFHLLLASVLLCAIGVHERRVGGPHSRHWFLLAAGFLLLSADEGGGLHERLIYLMHRFVQLEGPLASLWVIPGMMAVAGAALYFRRFLWQMPQQDGFQVVAAGAVFVSGAIGVEMTVSSMFDTTAPNWKDSFKYALLVHAEELLEMAGILLFNRFLLCRLAGLPPLSFAVRSP